MTQQVFSLFPAPLRRAVRLTQRAIYDRRSGAARLFVQRSGYRCQLPERHVIVQSVRPGATLSAKLHNMQKAIDLLQGIEIPPGRILSFWHIVGNPGERQGYRPGRNIINGKLVEDFGGGLCQLSSSMYELALLTGLAVPERHAHSTNVYTPETIYTPLGLDATLAYGYKDLRIRNSSDAPICFWFELSETELRTAICSPASLPVLQLRVEQQEQENGLVSTVYATDQDEEWVISTDFYKKWQETV